MSNDAAHCLWRCARALAEGLAYQIEDELTALPSVSQVEVSGVRRYEISIEVPLHRLRALGLTLTDIAHTIRQSSLDLSAGSINYPGIPGAGPHPRPEHEKGFRRDRSSQPQRRHGFAPWRYRRGPRGFQEADLIIRHQNHPAVFVEVFPRRCEQVMDAATTVREHLTDVVIPSLPTVWASPCGMTNPRSMRNASIFSSKTYSGPVAGFDRPEPFSPDSGLRYGSPSASPFRESAPSPS